MPVTAPAAPSMKQMNFLWTLAAERQPLAWMDSDGEWAADLDVKTASDMIAALLNQPRKPKAPLAHDDGNAVGEGYYALHDDPEFPSVYKVVTAKTTGNLYAKVLRVEASRASWVYAPGAMKALAGAARLTLEQAKEFGHLHGVCAICGRALSNPESVEAGIGPICAGRL
jgi:hypothetical protein